MLCGAVLLGCAAPAKSVEPAAPPPEPRSFSPSQGMTRCATMRGAQKIEAQMKAVALDVALQGISDATCYRFRLMPGATDSASELVGVAGAGH